MPTQRAIELFSILIFAVIGLSLLLQPLAWARLFSWLRREGEAGSIMYGLFCLVIGALIVSFHRVWFGLLTVLTIVGWLQVIKGLIHLLAPAVGLRLMAIASEDRTGIYRLGGVISLALAAIIYAALLPGGI